TVALDAARLTLRLPVPARTCRRRQTVFVASQPPSSDQAGTPLVGLAKASPGVALPTTDHGAPPWFAVTVPETACVAGKFETATVPDTGWVPGKLDTETEPATTLTGRPCPAPTIEVPSINWVKRPPDRLSKMFCVPALRLGSVEVAVAAVVAEIDP